MSDTPSLSDSFNPAAIDILTSKNPVTFDPEGPITMALVDDVGIPLIHRVGCPEPLVPAWIAYLKLLWPHDSPQLAQMLPVGCQPSEEERKLIEDANARCLFEFGPQNCRLTDTRDCTLMPFSDVIRCYETARTFGWGSGSPGSLASALNQQTLLFRLGSQGCLCPGVQRAGFILVPAMQLANVESCPNLEFVIRAGLGVTATLEEAMALRKIASLLRLPWTCPGHDGRRLVPLSSLISLIPSCNVVEMTAEETVLLATVAAAAAAVSTANGQAAGNFECPQCAMRHQEMQLQTKNLPSPSSKSSHCKQPTVCGCNWSSDAMIAAKSQFSS